MRRAHRHMAAQIDGVEKVQQAVMVAQAVGGVKSNDRRPRAEVMDLRAVRRKPRAAWKLCPSDCIGEARHNPTSENSTMVLQPVWTERHQQKQVTQPSAAVGSR